jgi:hypothetical protein
MTAITQRRTSNLYETCCQLLEEAVRELRGEEAPPPTTTVELRLGLDLRLPDGYVAEEMLRLALYRRVAATRTDDELYELHFDPSHPSAHAKALTPVAAEPSASLSPTGVVRLPAPSRDPCDAAQASSTACVVSAAG